LGLIFEAVDLDEKRLDRRVAQEAGRVRRANPLEFHQQASKDGLLVFGHSQ
jgi:hypothetical protein